MTTIKLGHSCLLVEENETTILIDPGAWNELPGKLPSINALLITHEHPDHLDLDKIKRLLIENPDLPIYTNSSVSHILEKENIKSNTVLDGQTFSVDNFTVSVIGQNHAEIYPGLPVAQNIGFLINQELFHPGDNFTNPKQPIETLALPVAGPWLTLAQAIDYAKALKPQSVIPVHDGMLKYPGPTVTEKILAEAGINFIKTSLPESLP